MKKILNKIKEVNLKHLDFYSFYFVLGLCIWPVLTQTYFVTLDGPSHLYNARLIFEFIVNSPVNASHIFEFNQYLVPNWISHFLMAILFIFLPDYLVEKTFIIGYLLIGAILFRSIVLHFNSKNYFVSVLIIPILPNALFYFGFYNFCFGFVAILLVVYSFIKLKNKAPWLLFIGLLFSFLILYFSHLFTFIIGLALVLIFSFSKDLKGIKKREILIILLAALPGLILTINYFIKIDSFSIYDESSISELFLNLINVNPLLGLCVCKPWILYSRLFGFALLFASILGINKQLQTSKKINLRAILLWGFVLSFLILYFIIPNSNLLTDRLLLSFFFLLILTLGVIQLPKVAQFVILISVLSLELKFSQKLPKVLRSLSSTVENTRALVKDIPKDTFILSFNFHTNWLHQHSASYIGSVNGATVLDNYEASKPWFPIKYNTSYFKINELNTWGVKNQNIAPAMYLNHSKRNFFGLDQINGNVYKIKYVVTIDETFEQEKYFPIKEALFKSYDLKNEIGKSKLYVLK